MNYKEIQKGSSIKSGIKYVNTVRLKLKKKTQTVDEMKNAIESSSSKGDHMEESISDLEDRNF